MYYISDFFFILKRGVISLPDDMSTLYGKLLLQNRSILIFNPISCYHKFIFSFVENKKFVNGPASLTVDQD